MTDRGLMKRYLLGTASPDERTALENRYLADVDAFEELTAAENDLIDSYTRGQLLDVEKQEFERRYLTSPKGRARVGFSLALAEISAQPLKTTSVQKPSFWQGWLAFSHLRSPLFQWGFAAVCAVALVATIGSFLVLHNRDLQARLGSKHGESQPSAGIAAQSSSQTHEGSTQGTEIAKKDRPVLGDITLQLNPGVSRTVGSGAPTALVVPSGTSWLNLQLSLDDDDNATYSAEVETAEGKRIQSVGGLKSQVLAGSKVVVLRLQANLLRPGDYVIHLKGIGKDNTIQIIVESYNFRIARR